MGKEIIKIKNLGKSFMIPHEKVDTIKSLFVNPFRKVQKDEFQALKNVNLNIEAGKFVGIVGTNGSGKSTLMKLIAQIYEPSSGTVEISGTVVPFLELGVGFNVELSGRENIFLNGTILGMKRSFLEDNFNKIVEFAEIEDFIDLPVKNYSSGMIVRLAFAIAIQAEAEIYLLDEVFSVGDAHFQKKCTKIINQLIQKGKTILFVSHSLDQIDKFADQVLWLDSGELKFFGDKDIGLRAYQNEITDIENLHRQIELEKTLEEQEKQESDAIVNKVGSFEVSIQSVSVEVTPEQKLKIETKLKHQENVEKLNLTYGIYKESGENVFSFSTKNSDLLATDASYVSAIVDVKDLMAGEYFINVAVFGKDEQSPYHWEKSLAYFRIESKPHNQGYRGIVKLDYSWTSDAK